MELKADGLCGPLGLGVKELGAEEVPAYRPGAFLRLPVSHGQGRNSEGI